MTPDRCAAYGCCEPPANVTVEFCCRHCWLLSDFNRWLHGELPVNNGGDCLVVGEDERSSFDLARAQWDGVRRGLWH